MTLALSGVWAVGHVITHVIEHRDHEVGREVTHGPSLALELTDGHGHEHRHPEPLPVVSTVRPPDLDASVLLVALPRIVAASVPLGWWLHVTLAPAAPLAASAAGPRAPPLS